MGVTVEIWHLWPPRSIVGVGDKHAHDSDHAECANVPLRNYSLTHYTHSTIVYVN